MIGLLHKVWVAIYFVVCISSERLFQYITSLPGGNMLELNGYRDEAGVLVLGEERVSGVTPNARCLFV